MKSYIYLLVTLCLVLASLVAFKAITTKEVLTENEKEDIMYMVSHSEYWSGEEGQVITRLLDFKGEPISANYCRAYISYPNKTRFIDGGLMSSSPLDSSYYVTFTVPETEGVYEYTTLCNYGGGDGKNRTAMKSFHVSPALNFQKVLNETITSGFTDVTENLSQIRDDTAYIRDNLNVNDTSHIEIIDRLDSLANFCGDNYTSSSLLCQWVNETKERVENIENEVTIGFTNIQNNMTYYYNTTIENIEDLDEKIEIYHDETMEIILDIQDDVNQTHEHVHLIVDMLNISLDEINVYAYSTGDCIIGSNWQVYSQVRNELNRLLTDDEVYCMVTTNFWGGPYNMSYDMLDIEFVYLHACDTPGNILWSVECLPLGG